MHPPRTCWLHPAVEVRPSGISGDGLFTTLPIAEGAPVSRLGGTLLDTPALTALLASSAAYIDTITLSEDLHLVLAPGTPNGKGNHSCDPNLWWDGPFTLTARRDIAAGEELTNDYGTSTSSPTWAMPCSCASALCRSRVTGADWRLEPLRTRYGTHWVPALLALME
ncbi:SET domain-containing protein-lysine N-methyltransferase [Nonomuraea sp. NBC_01738]|uniref:SET domain-containing protein n=1 Tax=Nonomuraea sp. NBC_01738 TaxID=2976003 RepID=UPI002E15ACEC|nr:SET domain-containing protein-lysine N-methyltransferase [Nonomuraea sp. NBC_01738]